MNQTSNLSPTERSRRRLASTPRPAVDNNGKPTTQWTYAYDADGNLIKAEPIEPANA